MRTERKYVISIAGFDPSGGAGILADVKTFEQLDVNGLGVCTAITLQTENEFRGVSWIPLHQIELQLDTLLQKYEVAFLKIGVIQSLEVLDALIQMIRKKFPQIKIVWDPILKSSSGFQFHSEVEENLLYEILAQIFLITPNPDEAKKMLHEENSFRAAKAMSRFCNVFLKSILDEGGNHGDILFEQEKDFFLKTEVIKTTTKHGSGCVLSAAIAASLAKGFDLKTSCENAKSYTHKFLKSTDGLLGMHHHINLTSQHA